MIYCLKQVFDLIIILRFIGIHNRTIWQLIGIMLQGIDIAAASMGQETCNGLSIFGHHQMNFSSIKIPLLAGLIASKLCIGVNLCSSNAEMVTHGNREAIHHIDSIGIQCFPCLPSEVEQDDKDFFETVKSSPKAALTPHAGDVAVLLEHRASTFMIASKA